jgi:uncharacterized protein
MASVGAGTGRVIWHELLAPDVRAASRFYRDLLGWETQTVGPEESEYPVILHGGSAHGGFQRIHPDAGITPHWLPYFRVDDPDATAARARTLGASLRADPLDVRGVGRLAIIVDPDGGELAVLAPTGERAPRQDVFVWDELHARDVAASRRFYTELFGWGSREASFRGDSLLFTTGDEVIARLTPASGDLLGWVPYLAVSGLEDVLSLAGRLGATTLAGAAATPGVGRSAMIADPVGAAAGLLEAERSGT